MVGMELVAYGNQFTQAATESIGAIIRAHRTLESRGCAVGTTHQLLRFGLFELNATTGELRKSGKPVKLAPQALKLLGLLASRAGQSVARDEIQKQLWGEETYVDFEHGVNKCIKQIRDALGDEVDEPQYIETLPRYGYRFLAPVASKVVAAPRPNVVASDSSELSIPTAVRPSVTTSPSPVAGAGALRFPVITEKRQPMAEAGLKHLKSVAWRSRIQQLHLIWIGSALLLVAAIIGVFHWRNHKSPALTEKDTIVIAEFENKTGDAVFDGTLRQGLSSQLEQSPFLNLLSDGRIAQALSFMQQPKDMRLSVELA